MFQQHYAHRAKAIIAAGFLTLFGFSPMAATAADCDRACLTGMITRYVDASAAAGQTRAAAVPPALPEPLFTFETDEFWLNLHHFLYVLGRAEAKLSDATEPSVAGAPADAARGLRGLAPEERAAWSAAVHSYAAGLSQKGTLEEPLPSITRTLAVLDDAPSVAGVLLDGALIATLERAAPIYRKAWWPAHRAANRAWRSATQTLIDRHGATVVDFVTRAYGFPWAASGQPVHVSSYANFGGAYSAGTTGILIVASMSELNAGFRALECIVHETMHQWDGRVFDALRTPAAALGVGVPRDLPHALIFYTAGEALRHIDASYVPTADAFEIWPKRLSGSAFPAQRLKPLLEEFWKPWLDGRGTRDEALAALLERAAAAPR